MYRWFNTPKIAEQYYLHTSSSSDNCDDAGECAITQIRNQQSSNWPIAVDDIQHSFSSLAPEQQLEFVSKWIHELARTRFDVELPLDFLELSLKGMIFVEI